MIFWCLLPFLLMANILLLLILYKLYKVHLKSFDIARQVEEKLPKHFLLLYQQIQSYDNLNKELPLNQSLPLMGGWAGSADFLEVVRKTIVAQNAHTVVECGSGVSSLIIGYTLRKQNVGHLYSLEHDAKYAEQTRQTLKAHNLTEWVTVIHAPLTAHSIGKQSWQWYDLTSFQVKNIDVLIVDGPPMATQDQARYPALPLLKTYFNNWATIILDDSARPDEQAIISRWQQEDSQVCFEKDHFCEKGCVSLQFQRSAN